MPITFRCQPCGKSYTVADSFAGRRARCKVCGAEMLIPTAAATKASKPADLFGLDEGLDGDSVEAEVPMGRVGASRRRSSEDSGSLLWLYVACGGAAGLALLIGLIVALAGGRGGKPEANNGEGDHLAQNEAPPPIPRVPSGRPRPSAPPNPADPPNAAPRFVRPDQAGPRARRPPVRPPRSSGHRRHAP